MMSGARRGLRFNVFGWNWRRGPPSAGAALLHDAEPLEIELSDYQRLPSTGSESPSGLLNGEGFSIDAIPDLDIFFERVYSYYRDKGLWCIIVKWIVEILSLGFLICFSGTVLLLIDWNGLRNAECGIDVVEPEKKPCDLVKEAFRSHPLVPFTFSKGIIVGYLAIFTVYWLFCFLRFFVQLKDTLEIRKFFYNSLNITDCEVKTAPWPEVLEKIVQIQQSQKLCVAKDLSAHDVVMRIMRKENYLIGMLNKGAVALPIPQWMPGAGPVVDCGAHGRKNRLILTKTLEWTLNWCILHTMFDRNYCVRRDFLSNPSSLRKRMRIIGIGMLLLSPFLIIFMLVYLFLRHAEQFYNHPSTASSRRWSNLSRWIFREYNEVDHLFRHRMNNSLMHASCYLKQFPSPIVSLIAKFICFVFGGFTVILLMIAFLDKSLLEGHIFGRNLLWYAAVFGTVTAISRALVSDDLQVVDPEGAMALVVPHTHYMPKRWRGKENTALVRMEFEILFQYTGMMLLEEMASIFLTPYLLLRVVPKRINDILQFISDVTVYVEGVGHVCSFSTFDFEQHGNSKYGSPCNVPRTRRSSQGKMEKSFLSFQSAYPSWEPPPLGSQFLFNLYRFREQQISQEIRQGHSPSQPWNGQSDIAQRFPSRDSPHDIEDPTMPGYNLGRILSINPEPRTYPYLLDWYYITRPNIPADDIISSRPFPTDTVIETHRDRWRNPTDSNHIAIDIDGRSDFIPSLDRLNSHLGASTSGPFLHSSIFRRDNPSHLEDSIESQWWRRSGPRPLSPETSFLEPPSFVPHGYISDRSEEELQQEDNRRLDLRKSQALTRTTYLDDFDKEEALNLPFNDIYTGPPKKLPFGMPPDIKS